MDENPPIGLAAVMVAIGTGMWVLPAVAGPGVYGRQQIADVRTPQVHPSGVVGRDMFSLGL